MRGALCSFVLIALAVASCGTPRRSVDPQATQYVGAQIATARGGQSGPLEVPSAASSTPIRIISVSDGHPGSNATVIAQTAPETPCSIQYHHPSGKLSTTRGLTPRTSDPDGLVKWTFRIDSTTQPGNGGITVTCGGATASQLIHILPP